MATNVETTEQVDLETTRRGFPRLSWGGVIAGLAIVIASGWLLYLFGLATGLTVVDITDGGALGEGMAIGAIVWMLISTFIAYFVGSLVAARVSGQTDEVAGMLHGVTTWAAAVVLAVVLGVMGVSSALHAGYNAAAATLSAGASAGGAVTREASRFAGQAAQGAWDLRDSELADDLKAALKAQAADAVSQTSQQNGAAAISEREARNAIESLNAATLQDIAQALVRGNTQRADDILARETPLTNAQIDALVDGATRRLEEALGMAANDQPLPADIAQRTREALASQIVRLDPEGGARVTEREIQRAIRQLDLQAMRTISTRLMEGDAEGAKTSIAANTNLTRAQVNALVTGAEVEINQLVEEYEATMDATAEELDGYAQTALWTAFLSVAGALVVSILGGWLGTETVRRYAIRMHGPETVGVQRTGH